MTKIGKLWTDSTAYLALLIGAGLSIAGNVADTYRTRGHAVDTLDIVMAVAWPALVVLMVEIFVSARWTGLEWPMQVLRWAGTLAIGGMAMRVSWVHLNDLMASRGQKTDVAILGPLAIDLLAIMATALILAGRRTVAKPKPLLDTSPVHVSSADMTALAAAVDNAYAPGAEHYLDRLAGSLDSTTTPAVPVVPGKLPQRVRPADAPRRESVAIDAEEALIYAQIGARDSDYTLGQISELLGGYYGVSSRTIRRQPWWPVVSGRPVSGA